MSIKRVFLFAVLTSLLSLVALSASAQDEITIRYTLWIPPDAGQMEAFNAIKADYEGMNPGVVIEYDFIPFNDYESVLTLQLSGTNPPDAGWLVERSAPTFIQAGVLADIAPVLNSVEGYDFADFSEPAMSLWTEGESVYGIPFSTSPFLFIYNKTLWEEAGVALPDDLIAEGNWNWSTVSESLATITESTGTYGFQSNDAALYTGNFWITLVPILRAYGGDVWDADNQCVLNSEGSVEALTVLHSMIFDAESAVPPGTEIDFFAGDAASTIGQLSRVGRLADAEFEWDIAPLPSGSVDTPYVIGQAAMSVFNNSANSDVAADFVRFMTTQENVTRLSAYFPPIRASVLESQAFLDANPSIVPERINDVVATAINNGTVLASHPNFPTIELTTRALLDELWTPGADIQSTADLICGAIQPLLDQ